MSLNTAGSMGRGSAMANAAAGHLFPLLPSLIHIHMPLLEVSRCGADHYFAYFYSHTKTLPSNIRAQPDRAQHRDFLLS